MNKIDFLATDSSNHSLFIDCLRERILDSTSMEWAVAYGQHNAFLKLEDAFKCFFSNGGAAHFVFDLQSGLTDPELIEELSTYPGNSFCKVYYPVATEEDRGLGIFHHKLYCFSKNKESFSNFIGSLNFTHSAIYRNFESGVMISGDCTEPIYTSMYDYYYEKIWNSPFMVSPNLNPQVLEDYKDLFRKVNKENTDVVSARRKLKKTYDDTLKQIMSAEIMTNELAYLMGLICGSATKQTVSEVNNRTIHIWFKSQIRNMNSDDEGFICVRVDGEVLGNIRISQNAFQHTSIKRMFHDLENYIHRDSEKNTISLETSGNKTLNYDMKLVFDPNSNLWKKIKHCIDQFQEFYGGYLPVIPTEIIDSDNANYKINFLRGYLDLRSRLSKSDRYPNGKLRVAIQIGTYEAAFGAKLGQLLDQLGVENQFSDGSTRNKDNMIRFIPQKDSYRLWTTGEYRLLCTAFYEYNKRFDR